MLRKILNIILAVSLLANIFLAGGFIWSRLQEKDVKKQLADQQLNEKTLLFGKLFVQKVLQGADEINFEDRLQLENAVRDLNDSELFFQWQKFTKSATNTQAQQEVSRLFILLLDKIKN